MICTAALLWVNTARDVSMIIELLLPSLLAGLCMALASGTLGCFVVWRKMAFFSDALAHSALLGTALALIAHIDIVFGLLAYGALVAIVMARYDSTLYSSDTLLAIISQASLALGLLLLPFAPQSINIEALLFGDILSASWPQAGFSALVTLGILTCIGIFWHPLLDLSIDEELAATEGVPVKRLKLVLFLLLVGLIAIAVQVVGVLLISALLLIPVACARQLARSPLQMLILAPLVGMAAVFIGLASAWQFNTAAGPSMVLVATLFWLLSLGKKTY
jgi:zinc transport system permease protein